jgi:GNAT superfamily N-acetyltransferase
MRNERASLIRPAEPRDVDRVVELVRALASYERAEHEVRLTSEALHGSLFAEAPAVFCHVAEVDEQVVGFAIWFLNFSTWLGRHGIYLEDLFVEPTHRGLGLGKALLQKLAAVATERGYGRLEWWVLDWNEPAQGFYRSLGADPMTEWTVWRVTGDALTELGDIAPD